MTDSLPDIISPGLLWLVLPPLWTGAMAESVDFPVDAAAGTSRDRALMRLVNEAVAGGLAVRRGGLTAQRFRRSTFWATDRARERVIAAAIHQDGRSQVIEVASEIAVRLRRYGESDRLLPVVRHWIGLVTEKQDFLQRVREFCGKGRVDRATHLVAAADVYLPLALPAVAEEVERAHRQVTLAARRSHDVASMSTFQPRPEWADALTEVLDATAEKDPWALHLLGLGGTGKTTFVRYVASGRFAEDRNRGVLPVARVDFDHLNPEFPIRRPVQLLVEFADELAPFADPEGDRALDAFYAIAKSAHAAGGSAVVDQAVGAFCRFVLTLPQPTLLVMDTCEELSKLELDGGPGDAVKSAFQLLDEVHNQVPSVRVLLSGRRPLSQLAGPNAQYTRLLEQRPLLRVLEARGFRRGEAVDLLRRREQRRVMDRKQVEAVLERSPEPGRVLQPDPNDGDDEPRFSPYDLTMYWRWWAADRKFKADNLRDSRRHAYVEARIVGKLKTPLLPWLPAVALLGRFDQRMLSPAVPDAAEGEADAVVRELSQQEWTDTDTDPASRSLIVQVDPPLRPQLLDWAESDDRLGLMEVRDRLAAALAADLQGKPLEVLSTAHVMSALRLATPGTAAEVWERLERRAVRENGWAWLATLCPRILGVVVDPSSEGDGEGLYGDTLLAAAVRATMIGRTRRDSPGRDLTPAWEHLEAVVGNAKGPVADRLRLRALLARARYGSPPRTESEVAEVARRVDAALTGGPSLAGSVVAVIEAIVEGCPPEVDLRPVGEVARRWLRSTSDPVVRAVLRVSLRRIGQTPDGMPPALDEESSSAAVAVEARAARPDDGRWADWSAPSDCEAWASLHDARDNFVAGKPLKRLPLLDWERQAEAALHLIDGERLMAQCLQLRMGYGVVARDRLDLIRALDRYDATRLPVRSVHDQVPPLFAVLSEAYLMAGDAVNALAVLRDRRGDATSDRREDQTVREADRAIVHLTRRLRDERIAPATRSRVDKDNPGFRAEVWAAAALVDGVSPQDWGDGSDPRRWHDCWQAQSADVVTGRVRVPVVPDLRSIRLSSTLADLLRGDAREAEVAAPGAVVTALTGWSSLSPPDGDGGRLARLRGWLVTADRESLLGPRVKGAPSNAPLHEALLALEFGELRALRDPAGALALLDFAYEQIGRRSPVLAMQTATVRALAILHMPDEGDRPSPIETALELANAYEKFAAHVTDRLPEWQVVVDTTNQLDGPWRGWLQRIRTAARWLVPETDDEPAPAGEVWGSDPVELFGRRFGSGSVAVPPGLPVQADAAAAITGLDDHRGVSLLTAVVRWLPGEPRITLDTLRTPGRLTVIHDHLQPAWVGSSAISRRVAGRPLRAEQAPWNGTDFPTLSPSAFRTLPLRKADFVVGRIRVSLAEQALEWEEFMENSGAGVTAEQRVVWFRDWTDGPALEPVAWRPGHVEVLATARCVSVVEDAYGPARGIDATIAYEGEGSSGPAERPVACLHVIGRPVFDSNGTLLQVTEKRDRRRPGDEVFVGSDDIAGRRANLVVLQGLPHGGRLRIDPFEASVARQFAVDAMVAGTVNLLVVPALPRPTAADVLKMIATLVKRDEPPGQADLLALADRIRGRIGHTNRRNEDPAERQVLGQVVLFLSGSARRIEHSDEITETHLP